MNCFIKKINGIQGFCPTTYAVFDGNELIKIVGTKKEAEKIKENIINKGCFI